MNSPSDVVSCTPELSQRRTAVPWRRVFGGLLVVLSIAHLAGTSQGVAAIDDNTGIEAVVGLVDLDGTAMLVVWAVLWAALAAVSAVAAVWTLTGCANARSLVVVAATASLLACLVGLWPTTIGVVVNSGLLVGIRLPIWGTG